MKHCLTCQRTYADDTLRFCLHDGGELVLMMVDDPEATLVVPGFSATPTQVVPLTAPTAPLSAATYQPSPPPAVASDGAWGWKLAVVFLVLALGGVLSWALLLRERPAASVVTQTDNGQTKLPTPKRASPTATPAPATTSTPVSETLNPDEREQAEADVRETLDDWAAALNDHDLESFLSHYADRLEVYYRYRNWTREQVREDKERAFDKYYEMEGSISDLRLEVDSTGRRATATFLKTYYFKGDEKDFSGSTRSQMTLIKGGGGWLIVGERDL